MEQLIIQKLSSLCKKNWKIGREIILNIEIILNKK